ncbi:hypothetical protein [Tabrizicola aquatica]|uniref:hypothetical protein n=1 Tax=Tabrizicola aquatica TaxID=909926 RepID=UPI000CD02108|nr:hypothetical protein [Tabrizicola aquatica]
MRRAFLLALLAAPAAAQTPMTPEEFEAWATGKTLDYAVGGQVWGSEAYHPGRRVTDADADGPCRAGRWFPREGAVCFVYQDLPGEHCWRFWRDGQTVLASPLTADPADPPQTVTPAAGPLACPGPDVGV